MKNRLNEHSWKSIGDLFTIMVVVFVVTLVIMTIAVYINEVFAYEFVYCLHEPTNTTITYPEGTDCNQRLEEQDEKEHKEESEEWKKNQ